MKNITLAALLAFGWLSATSFAQQEIYEDSYGDAGAVDLPGFEGCQAIPANDRCESRVKCTGEAEMIFNDASGLRSATKSALADAKAKYAAFYGDAFKAEQSIQQASKENKSTSSADGVSKSARFERIIQNINGSKTAMLIKGLQTLSREIDGDLVRVQVGASCTSRRAAGVDTSKEEITTNDDTQDNGAGRVDYEGDGSVSDRKDRARNADNF